MDLRNLCQAGFRFAGMTGYMTFPRAEQADARDYGSLCEAWCHCFREPECYLPYGSPQALISHSDFTDYVRVSPKCVQPESGCDYDFIYVGATEPWQREAKNWALAARCIPRICRDLHLRALVVGTPDHGFKESSVVRFTPPLPWGVFLTKLARARFLFAPNHLDASPRVLAEALCLNVPLVVNRHILGGWKYVNAFTGAFFEDENDVVAAVQCCLEHPIHPRLWYCAHYGPYLAGRRLLQLLQSLDPSICERSHVIISETVDGSVALER